MGVRRRGRNTTFSGATTFEQPGPGDHAAHLYLGHDFLARFVLPAGDNVDGNDIGYNKVFPYAATPLNGRTHGHH